ncbi:MAG: hypothetical protein ACE5F1_08830, partial [Planctomycetota bacterium]
MPVGCQARLEGAAQSFPGSVGPSATLRGTGLPDIAMPGRRLRDLGAQDVKKQEREHAPTLNSAGLRDKRLVLSPGNRHQSRVRTLPRGTRALLSAPRSGR